MFQQSWYGINRPILLLTMPCLFICTCSSLVNLQGAIHTTYGFAFLQTYFFIRSHFISNLVLDSLEFKKLLELQRRDLETFHK